jgi:iron complex transport system ATP-binding protein
MLFMLLQNPHREQPPTLAAEAVEFSYGQKTILPSINFKAYPGELTILVGANGSGKSTILSILARINRPQSGHVTLLGRNIHTLPTGDVAKKLALLPQGPIAPEAMTVRELVAQGRFPHQSLFRQWTSQDEIAVTQAMQSADVTEFADRQVDTLSGGQRQRCWIAMVLAQQTEVLLFDEPTTFLDLKVQVDLMNILQALAHEQKRTVVVVLHELNLAAAYADQLVMMKSGRIVAQGTPKTVFTQQNLKSVFDLNAHVITDTVSGSVICVPQRTDAIPKKQKDSVHKVAYA